MSDTSDTAAPLPLAVITGASRGIGRAFALEAAKRGYEVLAIARTVGGLEELDDDIFATTGRHATLLPLNLTDSDKIDLLGPQIYQRWPSVALLGCFAGEMTELIPTWQMEPKTWDRLIALHATANARLLRTLDPLMKQAPDGATVVVAEGNAPENGRAFWTAYAASKAAQHQVFRTYANEVKDQGVRLVMRDPGPAATNLRRKAYPGEDPATLQSPAGAAAKLWAAVDGT